MCEVLSSRYNYYSDINNLNSTGISLIRRWTKLPKFIIPGTTARCRDNTKPIWRHHPTIIINGRSSYICRLIQYLIWIESLDPYWTENEATHDETRFLILDYMYTVLENNNKEKQQQQQKQPWLERCWCYTPYGYYDTFYCLTVTLPSLVNPIDLLHICMPVVLRGLNSV